MNEGIICKVWNIQGQTATRSTTTQLGDSIEYILNDEKTERHLEMKTSNISDPLGQLGRECKYVENDVKTMSGAYVGSRNLISTDVNSAVKEMLEVKEFYGKTGGRAALHGLISLSEEESNIGNASLLMQLCEDVLREVFPDNQAIFGVHTNTDNLHIHFIINSVGLDGRKIHQNDKFIKEVLHPCVNKYAKKYGFVPNEKWEKGYADVKKTFVDLKIEIRKAIDIAIEQSEDFNEFVDVLKQAGFVVNIGKYISLKKDDMGKAIRTHSLGSNYSKDAIVERITNKRNTFEEVKINNYVIDKGNEDVFIPGIAQMKKYKNMNQKEKEYVLKQIKLGKNPWREHYQLNWQLNRIADELNKQERVISYIDFYSSNGTLQGALDGIVEAKKKISIEKKIIEQQKRKYKPILDIYFEMKDIQKKAYLYEHENVAEYRAEFEEYRNLTRRLKEAYGKDILEVARFVEECDERLLYAHAQLHELSEEYKEIKSYLAQYGEQQKQSGKLSEVMGVYMAREEESRGIYAADAYFIASRDSEFIVRIINSPTVDSFGNVIEAYEITVLSKYGEIVEQFDSKSGRKEFFSALKDLEDKYGMYECRKYENLMLARQYTGEPSNSLSTDEEENITEIIPRYSFTQAVNYHAGENGTFMIVDAETPAYMAMVNAGESELKITVFDDKSKIQESIKVPVVKNRTSTGYKQIVALQKKYGFSDSVLTFENVSDARKYVDANEKNNIERSNIVMRG